MKVCIHRGANEIGGSCVEIESGGKRIVLDIGLPLGDVEANTFPLPKVSGFASPDPNLLGVIVSHGHQDHYGLAHRLPVETPFLIGKAAEAILAAAAAFSPAGLRLKHVTQLQNRVPITLGPFIITPYLVDHSAYDAYAILVQADGKRLFYSADFRSHGRKGALFEKLIKHPPLDVDVLLMEGTTIGRAGADDSFTTEEELEDQFAAILNQSPGMALVCCSGQNIDRLVTIFKSARKAKRQFIIDAYTAAILQATDNPKLPQGTWEGVKVFVPINQRISIKRANDFDAVNRVASSRIFPEKLKAAARHSVMMFRASMIVDLQRAHCLEGAHLIYSLWRGYSESANDKLQPWLKRHNIPLHHCHTSGHASVADLKKLRQAFAEATVVPIHSTEPGRYEELFANVMRRGDGEWWEVQGSAV